MEVRLCNNLRNLAWNPSSYRVNLNQFIVLKEKHQRRKKLEIFQIVDWKCHFQVISIL